MIKEQKICDILAREYPEVYADIEKQVGDVKSEEVEMWIFRDTGLCLCVKEPYRLEHNGAFRCNKEKPNNMSLPKEWFPSVKFNNSPKRVKLILED